MRCKECGAKITYESMTEEGNWSCSECGWDTGEEG
jgi:DNA-directed RNA polymerase subunit RPC12/RpoP